MAGKKIGYLYKAFQNRLFLPRSCYDQGILGNLKKSNLTCDAIEVGDLVDLQK